MFYLSSESAARAIPHVGKNPERLAVFRALGPDALTEAGLRELCGDALSSYSAEPGEKTRKKFAETLTEVLALADGYVASPLPTAVSVLRGVAPVLHGLLGDDSKEAQDAVKQVFRGVFRGDGALGLSAADAQVFLDFVADVLFASACKQPGQKKFTLLTRNGVLEPRPADAGVALAAFLPEALGALNTHDAKSSHPSAQFQGFFDTPATASRFLSADALLPYVSGRSSGGALKPVSWLEFVLPFRVAVAGASPVSVRDLLMSESARAALAAVGVTAFAGVPVLAPRTPGFDGKLMPRVNIKLSETESVALNLMPANSMLRATAALGARVSELSAQRVAQAARTAALDGLPEVLAADVQLSAEVFAACAAERGRGAETKRLLKVLNAHRKAAGLKVLADIEGFFDARAMFPAKRAYVPRSQVTSKAQNCGGAYTAFAAAGPFRFPAATYQPATNSKQLRRFHGGLPQEFEERVKALREKFIAKPSPMEKYQVGLKWLPARRQTKILLDHVTEAADLYCSDLRQLRAFYRLDEHAQQSVVPAELSPLHRYVLAGTETAVEDLQALAQQGIRVLRMNDKFASEAFVADVVARLSGTNKEGVAQ